MFFSFLGGGTKTEKEVRVERKKDLSVWLLCWLKRFLHVHSDPVSACLGL